MILREYINCKHQLKPHSVYFNIRHFFLTFEPDFHVISSNININWLNYLTPALDKKTPLSTK